VRFTFIVAVCFVCTLASSCTRGTNPAPKQEERVAAPQGSSPAPRPVDSRAVIVAFGDSLTAGVVERTYPQYLQNLLNQNGYAYRVDNQGVSGDTTTDGLARIDNVIAGRPALVLLEFGGNDGLRGIPVEATQKNLADMVERLQQAKIPVMLLGITLPPNYGVDYVKPFTAIFPALAKQYKLKFMPFLLINVYRKPGMMQPDGIHPGVEGNKIVAQDVFDLIEPVLKKG
jgi:acyl-CoA thioesterase-1